jgi:hypothetical protein
MVTTRPAGAGSLAAAKAAEGGEAHKSISTETRKSTFLFCMIYSLARIGQKNMAASLFYERFLLVMHKFAQEAALRNCTFQSVKFQGVKGKGVVFQDYG